MSTCLAVSKSIAVSSLGLYAGILTSTTVLTSTTPMDVITKYLKPVVCNIGCAATALGALASGSFGLSYFLAPQTLQHPYLLYGMLVAPISAGYLYLMSFYSHNCVKPAAEARKPIEITEDEESLVDLGANSNGSTPPAKLPTGHPSLKNGADGAGCPFSKSATKIGKDNAKPTQEGRMRCNGMMIAHLSVVTLFTIAGFVQSVVGVYGEGQFA